MGKSGRGLVCWGLTAIDSVCGVCTGTGTSRGGRYVAGGMCSGLSQGGVMMILCSVRHVHGTWRDGCDYRMDRTTLLTCMWYGIRHYTDMGIEKVPTTLKANI